MTISYRVPARLQRLKLGPWTGIDEKTEPSKVAPNKCVDAQNILLDEVPDSAVKRQGSREISLLPSGNPARDVGVFNKLDGTSYLLASDGEKLYYTTDPTTQANWTLLKSGLNSDGFLEFETAEDKIWITNGIDWVMSWDGSTLRIYDREQEVTVDNAAITNATVDNVQLTQADDYWNGQTLVWLTGSNTGVIHTITDFDAANDRLTFTPALTGGTNVTDRFKVGVVIPRGRAPRFWDGHLFLASTPENASEAKFHRLTDPNTGADIAIDHPLAWPATHQLDIYSADGDRIWGISPILRDRILIFKATGIFRIERNPLTIYSVELVRRAIGSRFPRSMAEKKGLLYFVGQDKDGLPDVYKTDMVNVEPVDLDGGVEPTLRILRQPNAVFRAVTHASKGEFDAGIKSTTVKTSGHALEVGAFDTQEKWETYVARDLMDTIRIPGSIRLFGLETFDSFEDGDYTASPPWTVQNFGGTVTVIDQGGQKSLHVHNTPGDGQGRPLVSTPEQQGEGVWEFKVTGQGSIYLMMNNASHDGFGNATGSGYRMDVFGTDIFFYRYTGGATALLISGSFTGATPNKILVYRTAAGAWTIRGNGETIGTATDTTHTNAQQLMLFSGTDFFVWNIATSPYTDEDSDQQEGWIIVPIDHTRAPDSLKRVYANVTLNGGSMTLESWTSDSEDFTTGTDPSGYVAFTNGAVPGSQVKQYQRIRVTLTPASEPGVSPVVSALYPGMLHMTQPIFIGSNITAWRTFLTTLSTPSGTGQEIKIRAATVTGTPDEGDWGAWITIANGNNIGTILGDGSPPTTRWVQIKTEQGPSLVGLLPVTDSFVVQWNEGAVDILPLYGLTHKKRYMFTAARAPSDTNDIIIVSDRNEGWMKYISWNINAMIHYKGMLVGFSSIDDKVLELDYAAYTDQNAAIDAFLVTREENFGAPESRKDLRFSYIHVGEIASVLEVLLKKVSDSTFALSKTFTLAGKGQDVRQNFPTATLSKRFQRKYRNNVADENMKLNGESLYFTHRSARP